MQRLLNWMIIVIIGMVTVVIFSIFFPYGNSSNDITLPENYYQLTVEATSYIVCVEPRSESLLLGRTNAFVYPSRESPNDVVVVTTNAGLKESDLSKPIVTNEDSRKLVELLNSLKPYALFHLRRLEGNQTHIKVYTRKNGSWTDTFNFWRPRFEKEWELLDTQIFSNDRGPEVGNSMLKRIYKMDCRLAGQ